MNFLTAPVMYVLGGLALAGGLAAGVQTVRLATEQEAHAETRAKHAEVLREIADKTAEAARLAAVARDGYDDRVTADQVRHAKEIDHAFDRGRQFGARIAAGTVRVRTVWRDRECPAAATGQGAEPGAGPAGIDPGRAEAIGRVLGLAGTFDADYRLAYERLIAAQGLLNACYEQPATPVTP